MSRKIKNFVKAHCKISCTIFGATLLALTTTAAHAQLPPTDTGSSGYSGPSSSDLGFNNQSAGGISNTRRNTTYTPPQTTSMPPINRSALMQSQNQSDGDYGSMNRSMGGGIPLGMVQDAWSNPRANMTQGQIAPGVVRFKWSPSLIMQIHLRTMMLTSIEFPQWEKISEAFVGDNRSANPKIIKDNLIMVHNLVGGIDTTLTVLGRHNIYQFYLRGEGVNTKKITDVSVFVDAPDDAGPEQGSSAENFTSIINNSGQGGQGQSKTASLGQSMQGPTIDGAPNANSQGPSVHNPDMIVPRDKMKFNMRMYDRKGHPEDREIAPEYIYTDGVWTYFDFGSKARSMNMPVARRVIDGVESDVNTRTIGPNSEILVAEAIGDFSLRNGQKIICAKQIDK